MRHTDPARTDFPAKLLVDIILIMLCCPQAFFCGISIIDPPDLKLSHRQVDEATWESRNDILPDFESVQTLPKTDLEKYSTKIVILC